MYNSDNFQAHLVETYYQIDSCSAVFIFPTLLADIERKIESRQSVPSPWVKVHKARAPPPFLLY